MKQFITSKRVILMTACLLLLIMVSHKSFWIDECGTARFACAPDWRAFFELLRMDLSSDSQMPFFMALAKGWSLCAGRTEYALRSLNIIFGLVAMVCAFFVGEKTKTGLWPVVVMMFHPFFWAYMDEFRPYMMQISAGWMMVLALLKLASVDRLKGRDATLFCVSGLLLTGSSMLGAVPLGISICASGWIVRKKIRESSAGFRLITACSGLVVLMLGVFYLIKLLAGAGGAKLWEPGLQNVFFSLYELFGFSGLGPGRNELRAAARIGQSVALTKGYLPLLGLLAAAYMGLMLGLVRMDSHRRNVFAASGVVVFSGVVALTGLAVLFGWPFWGRHLAPFYPFVVLMVSLLLANMADQNPRLSKIAGCGLIVLLACSALNIRFSQRFAKDDYRGACQVAGPIVRAGEEVWWGAYSEAAFYYGIAERSAQGLPKNMMLTARLTPADFSNGDPRMVVLSKAEIYDPEGLVRRYLDENSYQCTHRLEAISIWEPRGKLQRTR